MRGLLPGQGLHQAGASGTRAQGLGGGDSLLTDEVHDLEAREGTIGPELLLLRVQGDPFPGLLFRGDSHITYGLFHSPPTP